MTVRKAPLIRVVKFAVALIASLMASVLMAGCASTYEHYPRPAAHIACDVMGPHMPQRVAQADTVQTKVDALHRNAAYRSLCPETRMAAEEAAGAAASAIFPGGKHRVSTQQ